MSKRDLTSNAKGQPIYDLLRRAGLPVQYVIALGVFVHVGCLSDDVARRAGQLLQAGGFSFLSITKSTEKATHHNAERLAAGAYTYVDSWTLHCKVS